MATIKRIDGKETTQLTLAEYSAELATGPQATREDRVGELVIDIADPAYPVVYVINEDGNFRAIAPGNTPNAAGGNYQIQYNLDGQMAASANLIYDPITETVTTSNLEVVLSVASNLNPIDNDTFDLGTPSYRWKNVHAALATADDITVGNLLVTGNVSIANVTATQLVNGNSNVVVEANSNITMSVGGNANIITVTDTGTQFDGSVSVGDVANLTILGGSNNQFLRTDGNGVLSWQTAGAGAAGSNTDIQFNLDGNLAADPLFTYDTVTNTLVAANLELTDSVASNLEPIDDAVFDLGAPLYRWNNVYANASYTDNAYAVTQNADTLYANAAFIDNLTVANIDLSTIANGNSNVTVIANAAITISSNGQPNVMVIDNLETTLNSNLSLTGYSNLGNLALVTITGGVNGQMITTDGNGNLSWTNGGTGGSSFGNGTSSGNVDAANANITFSVNGVANVVDIGSDTVTIVPNVDIFGNVTMPNLAVGNSITAANLTVSANIVSLGRANLGNIGNVRILGGSNGQTITTDGLGNLRWSNGGAGNSFGNGTSSGNVPVADGNITFRVNGVSNVVVISDTATQIAGNVDITGDLYANNAIIATDLQAGNLNVGETAIANNLAVASLIDANNANFAGNVYLGDVAKVHINGGSGGQILQTDGNGNLSWINGGNSFANGTSNGSIDTVNGNITFGVSGNANVVVMTPTGIEITSNLTAVNANIAEAVAANNITVAANLTTANATVTANLAAGNANITANLTSANANITTLLTAANANILGNLATGNIQATGAIVANNITANVNISAGNAFITDDITANNATLAELLTANNATFTNNVAANNLTLTANLSAFEAAFTGNVTVATDLTANNLVAISDIAGSNITASANLEGANAFISGNVTANNVSVATRITTVTANVTGNLTAANANITTLLTATTAAITGNLTAGNAEIGNSITANYFIGDGGLLSNIAGSGILQGSYSFASPSPVLIGLAAAGATVTNVTLVVVTPFDDPATTLSVGDTFDAESLLPPSMSLPTVTGSYGTPAVQQYGADTQILLTINPGTSTQGDGVFTVTLQ